MQISKRVNKNEIRKQKNSLTKAVLQRFRTFFLLHNKGQTLTKPLVNNVSVILSGLSREDVRSALRLDILKQLQP